jgi:hypothetical protein
MKTKEAEQRMKLAMNSFETNDPWALANDYKSVLHPWVYAFYVVLQRGVWLTRMPS